MGDSVVTGGIIQVPYTAFSNKYFVGRKTTANYNTGMEAVKKLETLLCETTWLENTKLLFSNPSDYINSIKMYPLDLTLFTESSFAFLKLVNMPAYQINIDCRQVNTIYKNVLIGQLHITPKYNNFMDYEPYTKVEIYIPYFGFTALPTNEVMDKDIYLYLSVDFDTGLGTVYIQVEDRVIMTLSQKLGIDVPIGASNLNEVIKDNVANAVKTVAGIAMLAVGGGVGKTSGALLTAKGLSMAVTSGVDAVTSNTIRYTRGSLTGGSDMLASPTAIYCIITRPNALEITEDYAHIKGKPLGDIRVLSTLRGFTIIDQIHLQNMPNALDEEMNEIEALMKEGIEL